MAAATAKFYAWPPREVLRLRLSELRWWHDMAERLEAQHGQ